MQQQRTDSTVRKTLRFVPKVRAEMREMRHLSDRAQRALSFWHGKKRIQNPEFVYFAVELEERGGEMRRAGGPVKVGVARDPLARIAQLQIGNPRPLAIDTLIFGTGELERALHMEWAEAAVRGEWFGNGRQDALLTLARLAMDRQMEAFNHHQPLRDVAYLIPLSVICPAYLKRVAGA